MNTPVMRAKLKIVSVVAGDGYEQLKLTAVYKDGAYPADGSDEDNSFAMWTPTANLEMTINNPALHGKFKAGKKFYVDFTEVE